MENVKAVKVRNTTFVKSDMIVNDHDDISNILYKLGAVKEMQRELDTVAKEGYRLLVRKFVEMGEYDALQVKPSVLRNYR